MAQKGFVALSVFFLQAAREQTQGAVGCGSKKPSPSQPGRRFDEMIAQRLEVKKLAYQFDVMLIDHTLIKMQRLQMAEVSSKWP
jgi:hypothetical protein